ncbi:hypothetical protein [Algoriphagus hitonicola]|uniref:Uncharacterized protein n=1 Tax=Algoriphagus hitonicola TaxID=435880 RepID=A0A1I2PJQ8_9BACT|nr:hypothetical protein [Algoriphagus hitonicola]SFG14217.1 hypothetical protein SAMN04487988_101553 [Algoriphagus hitonicola]
MKFLLNLFKTDYYKRFNKILDNQSGKPETYLDWMTRAKTCEKIMKAVIGDVEKTSALKRIMEESLEMITKIEETKKTEFLSKYIELEGLDKYIQIGAPKFADEFRFYRNKSKIEIYKNNKILTFETMGGNPGRWYQYSDKETISNITLGPKSPYEILIEIENKKTESYNSFVVKLKKKT